MHWYRNLDEANKGTWDCEYCKKRKLDIPRNCQGKYSPTSIIINGDTLLTQCPLTLAKNECSEVYNLLKSTLMSEMGSGALPSQLLDELNIYFVYRNIINKAENSCRKE